MKNLGFIIVDENSPSVTNFSFVLNNGANVRRGEFVAVQNGKEFLIAVITNIRKTNHYYNSFSIESYNLNSNINDNFPIKEWEQTIAEAKILSSFTNNEFQRPSFPPSPGSYVVEIEPDLLTKFLNLDLEKGLELGQLQQFNLKAKFNMTKLLQKHLAILAISGAGKSYFTAVLLEELLTRKTEDGRIGVIVIDNHGEYLSFAKDPNFNSYINVVNAEDVKIGLKSLTGKMLQQLLPRMSHVQAREIENALNELKLHKEIFTIDDLKKFIETSSTKSQTKDALLAWLSELENLKIFDKTDSIDFEKFVLPGYVTILNLQNILDLKLKQIIVWYISTKLFSLRRNEKICPYLEIIEEAHNFAPEKTKAEHSLSKSIIETLAREGRKFHANICLISQRPVQLSTTALSQCNTFIFFTITNPYDLDHIGKSSEAITKQCLDIISDLKVGEALIVGEATNHPLFFKVRKRKSQELHDTKLEDYAKDWEKRNIVLAKGKEFLY